MKLLCRVQNNIFDLRMCIVQHALCIDVYLIKANISNTIICVRFKD